MSIILKKVSLFFLMFLLIPVVGILIGLFLLDSNLSLYHYNIYYFLWALIGSIPIIILYTVRKSTKLANDFFLCIGSFQTAISYIINDLSIWSKIPDENLYANHKILYYIILLKFIIIINCAISKVLITAIEYKEQRQQEKPKKFIEALVWLKNLFFLKKT
ncbi:hypothetical protein [Dickeya fangzhongdai]|uniref:hypothetical protein n=1 Tax=Dickeya fangzhongdai TaxID=1778540 RepID=UPI0026DEE785|nr:hypothetical protein [Dickeya fangzhongdai]WKV52157.1 hypothetical protein PL145_08065 [Dickeya fangzhongdai]